jgi:hypothetical protein
MVRAVTSATRAAIAAAGQCTEPDRDVAALICGYPLPCPHHVRTISRTEEHARTTIVREKQFGLEPLGIRGTRREGRRYSAFKVVYPPPSREVLPISTGVNVLPGQTARITARPQRTAFVPQRLFIAATGGATAADWVVDNLFIGGRSQFAQDGQIPGDMFATTAIDSFVAFEPVQVAMDIVVDVTYIGANPDGAPFFGSLVGRAMTSSTPTGGWIRPEKMTPETAAKFWPMHSATPQSLMATA